MGCSNVKVVALQELQEMIKQITLENDQLEKERDTLKSQHDDRPEEEKDSLQDLRLMHNDLEKEVKELKDIMLEFMPIPDAKDNSYTLVKNSIERISLIQSELEDQAEQLREMMSRRKYMQQEHQSVSKLISQTEQQIEILQSNIEKKEKSLKDQGIFDKDASKIDKRKTLDIEEIRSSEAEFGTIVEASNSSESGSSSSSDEESEESTVNISEMEIDKELQEVENELVDLAQEVQHLDLTEAEVIQMDNYINSLRNKMKATVMNSNLKQQITETQNRIELLKEDKKKLKVEVAGLKKLSHSNNAEETVSKIQALNMILKRKNTIKDANGTKAVNAYLISDIEDTLRKAREIAEGMKKG